LKDDRFEEFKLKYEFYKYNIKDLKKGYKYDVPEFVAISVTEAEDKFRKWKGWKIEVYKI
jgi:uncharacterized protein involved in tolerance to divalent cations